MILSAMATDTKSQEQFSLIGRVACRVLNRLLDQENGTSFARIAMQHLGRDEMAHIAEEVARDVHLKDRIEIALPDYYMRGVEGVQEWMLTDATSTELRTKHCDKEARLFFLVDDSQAGSNALVTKLNKDFLLDPENALIWIEEATGPRNIHVPEVHEKQWGAAIKGLIRVGRSSLKEFALYIETVATAVGNGLPVVLALGSSMWALRLPSFESYFEESIPDDKLGQPSAWKAKFIAHWPNGNYLLKRNKQFLPYTRRMLEEQFERFADDLPDTTREALNAFVRSEAEWNSEAEALAKIDWRQVRPVFEDSTRIRVETIGEKTQNLFNLLDPDTITPDEVEYVASLKGRGSKPVKNSRDEEFYHGRIADLQREPDLAAMWERFIFGTEITCTDFRVGIAECLSRLMPDRRRISGAAKLEITAEESDKLRFKKKSDEACFYFQLAYSGLESTLAEAVEFHKVVAFDYANVWEELRRNGAAPKTMPGKKANQLSFRVVLRDADSEGRPSGALRLVWNFAENSVLAGLAGDLERLVKYAEHTRKPPTVRLRAKRNANSTSSGKDQIRLNDLTALKLPGGTNRGAFVPAIARCENLNNDFERAVKDATRRSLLSPEAAHSIRCGFNEFGAAYSAAITALAESDFRAPSIATQAERFGELLEMVILQVSSRDHRLQILRSLLEIGLAKVDDGAEFDPTGIVCPWHPLRLESLAARDFQFEKAVRDLLQGNPPEFTDNAGRLFFRELTIQMENAGNPEVGIVWRRDEPVLVSESDSFGSYSVLEVPVCTGKEHFSTNENPKPVAKQISEVIDSYLELQPHERDNFSIVLYDCDSSGLPTAVVESIKATDEDGDYDAMCQVILTHRDRGRLTEIYQKITSQEGDDDAFHVSESSREFMARVRINIMVNGVPVGNVTNGQPTDIVFCQDVISRRAAVTYPKVPRSDGHTLTPESLRPTQWSRRKELRPGDKESIVFLTCPAQTRLGWRYLLATSFIMAPQFAIDSWQAGDCQVPAKQLDFDREETSEIFEQTHALGNWVVNLDDLLDRRLLRYKDVKVIRYKQSASQGRNLIISSQSEDHLLRVTLEKKLGALVPPETSSDALRDLCAYFIDHANEISGNLVLRAAKRGQNANELLGLVLSRNLVEHELGKGRKSVCMLLDDYAGWLGQPEGRSADLLILSPSRSENGEMLLDVVVTEAKFVEFDAVATHARTSKKQLRDSLMIFEKALSDIAAPSDQAIWLARLSDLLFEGLQNTDDVLSTSELRTSLRNRRCRICLRGYSHVFIHGPTERENDGQSYTRVSDTRFGHQEIFARSTVRSFISHILTKEETFNPTSTRTHLAGLDIGQRKYVEIACPSLSDAATRRSREDSADHGPTAAAGADSIGAESGDDSAPLDDMTGRKSPLAHVDLPNSVSPSTECSLDGVFNGMLSAHPGYQGGPDLGEEWLDETARRVRDALLTRNMAARLLQKLATPNAALLRFEGSARLTVAMVESKIVELKTTDGIEIIGIRPELGAIAISVARPHRRILSLHEVWRNWNPEVKRGNSNLLIALKESDGLPLFLSPTPNPHTLVAGFTGSGKSVLMQNIILGIAATNTPEQAQLVLIDPKGALDYAAVEGLPHLRKAIVTDPDGSTHTLTELVAEMERRQLLFRQHRAANIHQYIAKTGVTIPTIWVIHDEFGDWMQDEQYKDNITGLVNRLAQKARAVGIYMIFASQRPDATIFPMVLRSNLGNRLILKVDSPGTSDLALGIKNGGAERLLGQGHMLAITNGNPEPVYCQVPFISTDDLDTLVEQLRRRYHGSFAETLVFAQGK